MSMTLAQLEAEADSLSPEERHVLLDHLRMLEERDHPEVEKAWNMVISSRLREVLDDTALLSDHDAVLARLGKKYCLA